MTELRRAAKKRFEAMEAEAVSRIERMGLEAQAELLGQGIDTDAARTFLEASKASMAAFLPSLVVADMEKMMAPTLKRLASVYH